MGAIFIPDRAVDSAGHTIDFLLIAGPRYQAGQEMCPQGPPCALYGDPTGHHGRSNGASSPCGAQKLDRSIFPHDQPTDRGRSAEPLTYQLASMIRHKTCSASTGGYATTLSSEPSWRWCGKLAICGLWGALFHHLIRKPPDFASHGDILSPQSRLRHTLLLLSVMQSKACSSIGKPMQPGYRRSLF